MDCEHPNPLYVHMLILVIGIDEGEWDNRNLSTQARSLFAVIREVDQAVTSDSERLSRLANRLAVNTSID